MDKNSIPWHKRASEDFPVNISLLDLIAEISREDLCSKHEEKNILVCFTDKTVLCQDCFLTGQHTGHDMKRMHEVRAEIKSMKQQLMKTLKNIEKDKLQGTTFLSQTKTSLQKLVQQKFSDLDDALKTKELELLIEIDSFFAFQERLIDTHGINSELIQDLRQRLSDYEKCESSDIFRLLSEKLDLSKLLINLEPTDLSDPKLIDSFNATLSDVFTQLEDVLSKLDSPHKELDSICAKYTNKYIRQPIDVSFEPYAVLELETTLKVDIENGQATLLYYSAPQQTKITRESLQDVHSISLNIDVHSANFSVDIPELSHEDKFAIRFILKNLKQPFSLCVMGIFITDKVLLSTLRDISAYDALISKFVLHINNSRSITDSSLLPFVEKILPGMTNLRGLHLYISNTTITNQFLIQLSKCNEQLLRSLDQFEINLEETAITDEGLISLFNGSQLENAYHFAISLSKTKVTDEGALKILSHLPISKLKTFDLCLQNTKITDIFASKVLDTFIPSLSTMEGFRLYLENTDVSVEMIAKLGLLINH